MKSNAHRSKIKELSGRIVNRETISYAIAGILTTLVNFASYEGLYRLGVPNLTANWLAWVIAVTFAYIVNKTKVFQSKSSSAKEEVFKVTKFYGARLVSLIVEQFGMYVFVEQLGIYRWFVKASLSVIVIILNYIFSKLYIFRGKKEN